MLLAPHGILKLQPYRRNVGDDTLSGYVWTGRTVLSEDGTFIPIWPTRYVPAFSAQLEPVYFPKFLADCSSLGMVSSPFSQLVEQLADLMAEKHFFSTSSLSSSTPQLENCYPHSGDTQNIPANSPHDPVVSEIAYRAESRYEAGSNFYIMTSQIPSFSPYSFHDTTDSIWRVRTDYLAFDAAQAALVAAQHYRIGGIVYAMHVNPNVDGANEAADEVASVMAAAIGAQTDVWDSTADPGFLTLLGAESAIRSFFAT